MADQTNANDFNQEMLKELALQVNTMNKQQFDTPNISEQQINNQQLDIHQPIIDIQPQEVNQMLPTSVQPNPTIVQSNPTIVQSNPTIVQSNPTTVQSNPTNVQLHPKIIQKSQQISQSNLKQTNAGGSVGENILSKSNPKVKKVTISNDSPVVYSPVYNEEVSDSIENINVNMIKIGEFIAHKHTLYLLIILIILGCAMWYYYTKKENKKTTDEEK